MACSCEVEFHYLSLIPLAGDTQILEQWQCLNCGTGWANVIDAPAIPDQNPEE
jgi:hypothetical protein